MQVERFVDRHVGPTSEDVAEMLTELGFESMAGLLEGAVPAEIRDSTPIEMPEALSEQEALTECRDRMSRNDVKRSLIGMGYYGCHIPPVVQRNVFENPGWYTQYTPYQAEIAQGRLEALLNFQTMVSDLTGLEVSNASLLDEGTAAAEGVYMCYNLKARNAPDFLFIDEACHPQTIAVIQTRARALDIEVEIGDPAQMDHSTRPFGVVLAYPATDGRLVDYRSLITATHEHGGRVIMVTDLLALCLLTSPGELGADVAVGSAQRFGVPMGYGGPHAGFFATTDAHKRKVPGRIVGASEDVMGRPAYRLALATREQHIRRDKATSNICTAQVLLAIMASMYAVYHGPTGLRQIAERVQSLTTLLRAGLTQVGLEVLNDSWFDTLTVRGNAAELIKVAEASGVNIRGIADDVVGISLDETVGLSDVLDLIGVLSKTRDHGVSLADLPPGTEGIPDSLQRRSEYLTHPVFNLYHSETEMLRYIRKLESRDLSLTRSMIPLGSCTMKLNATSEMMTLGWDTVTNLHPFAPQDQVSGYLGLFDDLESWLAAITGFDAVSLQPNSGAQGEYAGLLVIRGYHESRGEGDRRICLIPSSAHGTNPASAALAGMKVVVVACDGDGNIDRDDLRAKALDHSDRLAALMVTYPSTHGVFEEGITEICQIIHDQGAQVYMDGANLQAQIGLCRAGSFGPDVCHINLHKTFAIPHGGGGPGMGPIAVKAHLSDFLPGHPVVDVGGLKSWGPVSAAPWGSSAILPISWMYMRMMGPEGLAHATAVAILSANYIARRLEPHYPIVYKGSSGLVAHECIIDLSAVNKASGVDENDIAKRLIDYGFHAPTVSWPVPKSMMIEPTESESLSEINRFCDAMIHIREEIREIENGHASAEDNVLKGAPHTAQVCLADDWDRPYSRSQAAYPVPWLRDNKFWPHVSRIDNVKGDRTLVCSCLPLSAFE